MMLGNFHPIDIALSKELLNGQNNERLSVLVAYLSAALREGHLCIKVSGDTLLPSPEDLDLQVSDQNSLISAFANIPEGFLIKDGPRIYFPKQWNLECQFLKRFQQLSRETPFPSISQSSLLTEIQKVENELLPEQKEAILTSATKAITLITGGPGTGKTYTAARLLRILHNSIEDECRIVLAAPTGKAASNLQRSLSAAFEGQNDVDLPKATTLHSLLKNDQPLGADILIIDECSMIDVEMMVRLLMAVKPGARLIMLGDPRQLPPVEAGGLFADLAQTYSTNHLNICRRAELKSILELADLINEGNAELALEFLRDHRWIKLLKDPKDLLNATEKHFVTTNSDPEYLIHFYNQFRILTPMRQGPWGSESLNSLFKKALMENTAPVMITKNDHELSLFNGEVGVLILANRQNDGFFGEGDSAFFPSGDSMRRIPAILLPKYEYAYCMSVHKSQGSEFDQVHVVLPEGAEIFGREVLYTAITRASKGVMIWTTEEILRQTILRKTKRNSGVVERARGL